ncbi:MAG TPA: DUF4124 domain-containing protein [Steroidobacteraceae bacterium]|nr:DUF4124 domain-containing protein [Steroidobacteraceae bacterium]
MRKYFSLAAAPLVLSLLIGAGEVYRWKDGNGVWHYSDQPQPGAELVKSARLSSATPGGSTPPPPAPAARAEAPPPALPEVTPQVASQVRQEAATAKAEQCKKAETGYQQAVQARRMYKTDDKGNRVFLNEAELDAARLQARSARDLACAT